MNPNLSRRRALTLLGLGAAGITLESRGATASSQDRSNPGYYRFNVGDFQLTVFNDGYKIFQPVQPFWASEANSNELNSALEAAFLPTDHVMGYYNVILIDTGKEVVLCDSGFGKLLSATAGHLASQLALAGYRPNQITTVFLSHAHPDHYGGLIAADGKPVFPLAKHFINETEWNFWTQKEPDLSKTRLNAEDRKTYAQSARDT
jgi:glyoxylase-like metal-dependent hydrolase (beta-lactamase superfamily II)